LFLTNICPNGIIEPYPNLSNSLSYLFFIPKAGDDYLNESVLGKEIRDLGLDPRREFMAFAAVFMEVAKRTRTPGDVMMGNAIASLQKRLSMVMERIERLPPSKEFAPKLHD
jgi:hypothetical protein